MWVGGGGSSFTMLQLTQVIERKGQGVSVKRRNEREGSKKKSASLKSRYDSLALIACEFCACVRVRACVCVRACVAKPVTTHAFWALS